MKRMMMIMLALLLCCSCAAAQSRGSASVAVRTALLDAPDDSAQTLMEYIRGTRVEVIREADAQYVQVNVGKPGGSLMGYMKKADLAFGEENVRLNRPIEVTYLHTGWTLRAFCDELADVLIERTESCCYSFGELGDWRHVKLQTAEGEITGFVNLKETAEWGRIRTSYDSAAQIRTWPTESEPTAEEAIAYAKARLVADKVPCNAMDGEIATQDRLDRCCAEAEMFYTYDSGDAVPLWYLVTFYYDDRTWEDGSEMICALACLYVEDGEIVAYDYGKG